MNVQGLSALFDQHAVEIAPALLGCELTVMTPRGGVTVRLTEVEAYGDQGEDPGAHSFNGRTARNASLFGPPRRTYVYQSYGIHYCLNLVANAEGAGGVLLRAGEVVRGRDLALERRGGKDTAAKLLSGPGRLGQGLGIILPMDGSPLELNDAPARADGPAADSDPHPLVTFSLAPAPTQLGREDISAGPRVGVSGVGGSAQFPWRFWITGDRSVSAYRPGRGVPPGQN
ncbi:DNA-3-methyladenine glycosylase [Nesterenkonia flava]|uniref:Putative 3-methyladenine DNA glycosylase n=1 Tax=Nesterenkonia flava TaxID=469799 RepID=A0ABU1FVK1_9MICC|nr:DNA-3-methyladenine glycosylase [Nesterenkonia flava]MDR5712705.1 DNA-3-methyladenine glycosylase [Nesterenkonia flava]